MIRVAGMFISLLFVPVTIPYILVAFVLFRFFDIIKPLFIRRLESLPGGWGVMADDILAGVYTNIIIHAVVWFNLLNVKFCKTCYDLINTELLFDFLTTEVY